MSYLFLDQAESVAAFPWVDVATKLGVPTAMLAFMVWFYVRTATQYGIIVASKDAEISRLNKEHDGNIASIVKEYSAELSRVNKEHDADIARLVKENSIELARVNDQRVKESQDMTNRMLQRDSVAMDLLNNTDKTLSLLLEKVR